MKFKLFFLLLLSFVYLSLSQELTKDVQEAMKQITEMELKSHILFLADDLLEGRKSGSYGNNVASAYIASQFEAIGLSSGCEKGKSYFQTVKMYGVTMDENMKLLANGKNGTIEFKYYNDFVGSSLSKDTDINIRDAEVIFAGYGIEAPEFQWNDYKDMDVKGKILLVMNNDPLTDPNLFEGKRRMYYGRWTYKYEKAAEKGALGVIIIHTAESAAYDWQVVQSSFSGEGFELLDTKDPKLKLEGWLTEESSKKLTNLGGFDLDELRKKAESKDFKPIPLNVKISLMMKGTIRNVDTRNVVGIIEGRDKKLKNEYVVYTSHFDHLGIVESIKGDSIYNGAFDNATGVSSIINIAKAFMSLKTRPKRSIIFIATAAEEDGTLGAKYFVQNPTIPLKKIVVNLNLDAVNIWGIAKNVELVGGKYSDLFDIINGVAKKIGMYAVDEQDPNAGSFYRSDQFEFVRSGIPGVYLSNGNDFEGKPEGWGKEQFDKFRKEDYHQPSDEVKEWWKYDGMVKNSQLYFLVGLKLANDNEKPKWKKGTEFERIRKR